MAQYYLKPHYGDMSVVVLGASVKTILNKLKKKHWEEELSSPEEYDEKHIKNIKKFLDIEFKNPEDLCEEYNKIMDEEYVMEVDYS